MVDPVRTSSECRIGPLWGTDNTRFFPDTPCFFYGFKCLFFLWDSWRCINKNYIGILKQEGKFTILFSGYARDGGLYFPENIPCLGKEQIEEWADLSYPDLVKKIMSIFISEDEIPTADLANIIDNAFKKFTGWLTMVLCSAGAVES